LKKRPLSGGWEMKKGGVREKALIYPFLTGISNEPSWFFT
jgi:hypothetical protein